MLRRTFLAAFLAAPPIRLGIIGTGNRGTSLGQVTLAIPNVEITALCDIDITRTGKLADQILSLGRPRPTLHADYRQLLDLRHVDAVLVASPEQTHAAISVAGLRAGKAVLSEVAAAVTLEECWQLVEAVEQTRGFYMMAENCCYYRSNLAVLAMANAGVFGDITYADCAYLHSLPGLGYTREGALTWRGQLMRDTANWYPTHAIGPVAQWLGIGAKDRFATLRSLNTPASRIAAFTRERYGASSPAATSRYQGDANFSLIETRDGRIIEIRLDTISARPTASTTHYLLQGTHGAYRDAENQKAIWLEGTHKENAWGDWQPYEDKYEDARWRAEKAQAAKTGHGGADWFTLRAFFEAIATRQPSPIDVYSSVEWSSIIALSTQSAAAKGAPQAFPNFRRNQRQ